MLSQSYDYVPSLTHSGHPQGCPPALPGSLFRRHIRSALRVAGVLALLGAGACSDEPTPPVENPDAALPQPAIEWTESIAVGQVGWLMNVWGLDASTIYAVGGEPAAGTVMRFDGQSWERLDLGMDVPLLNWTHGFGPDDITVVGNGGTIIHWDGAIWTMQETPTTEDLWGVWGASPDDLWAVGGRGRAAGQETILHYDGNTWTAVEPPALERPMVHAFFKIWGTSADNVYIVGQRGAILHFDGAEWTEQGAGTGEDLISLWGTGPDRIVAVGGRGSGVVAVWDGQSWTSKLLGPQPGLNGVWMDAAGTVYAVGVGATAIVLDVDTLEYEQIVLTTEPNFDLHGVFSPDGREITAVGGNLSYVQGPYRGAAYRATIPEEK